MPDTPSVGRWPVTVESFERLRGHVALELWQLRDAVDGRVSSGAVVTALVLQSFGRSPKASWPGLEGLARALRLGAAAVECHLIELEGAGWIDRVEVGDGVHVVCRASKREGPPAGVAPPPPAVVAPAEPAKAKPRKRPVPRKIARSDCPADLVALAVEIHERYPHGRTADDKKRAANRRTTEDQLLVLFEGLEGDAREALATEIRTGLRAFAASAPPEDHPQRQFVWSLERWLNNHAWRDGGREAAPRLQHDPRQDGGARVGFHVGANAARPRAADAVPVPQVDPAALEAARRRREGTT